MPWKLGKWLSLKGVSESLLCTSVLTLGWCRTHNNGWRIKEVCVYHEMEVEVIGIVFWERSQVPLWPLQSNVLFLIIRKAEGKVCLCWVITYALLVCGSCLQAINELIEKEILHQTSSAGDKLSPALGQVTGFQLPRHLLSGTGSRSHQPPRHQSSPHNTRWSFLPKHAGICICYIVLTCTGWKILLVQVV